MENKIKCIQNIRVTTGFDCNCICSYCSQRNSHIADRIIGDGNQMQSLMVLLQQPQLIRDGELIIELEGGEPLLHPDVIRDTVLLCDQIKDGRRNVRYNLVSNCQLLNRKENRDIIDWIVARDDDLTISVSFDHMYKNPRILTQDTLNYIKSITNSVVSVYVVENKNLINRAATNIRYLNEHGFTPIVYWNFLTLQELNNFDTRKQYVEMLRSVKTMNKHGVGFSGDIQGCGWIGVSPQGRLFPCSEAAFGSADLSIGEYFDKHVCSKCELNNFCHQCMVRKSLYQDKLCGLMKTQYAIENNCEVM